MDEEAEHIIDPPVGPYSPRIDIEAWIEELQRMKQTENVRTSIDEARNWLNWQDSKR